MNKGWITLGSKLAGIFLCCLGLLVIFGWFANMPILIQINPSFAPMQFNTALCFLMAGIVILSDLKGRKRVEVVAGFLIALISSLSVLEYFTQWNLGIDELFVRGYITVKTKSPGRMSIITASCFVLSALSIFAFQLKKQHISTWLSLILLAVASSAFFGYLFGVDLAYAWTGSTAMAFHTASGMTILAIALVLQSIRDEKLSFFQIKSLPLSLGIGLFALTIWVSQLIVMDQGREIEFITEKEMATLSSSMETSFGELSDTFIRLAHRSADREKNDLTNWQKDATSYLNDLTFYRDFSWVSSQGQVFWTVPFAQSKYRDFSNLLSNAKASKTATLIENILPNGKQNEYLLYYPVYSDKKLRGLLIAKLDLKQFLKSTVNALRLDSFLSINHEGVDLYSNSNVQPNEQLSEKKTSVLGLGLGLGLKVYASPATLAIIQNHVPDFVFAFGTIISLLVSFAFYLWQRADVAGERFKLVAQGSEAGIWDWMDVTKDEEYWSLNFYRALGYDPSEFKPSLQKFSELLHPDDKERTFKAVDEHFLHNKPFKVEYRLLTKKGEYRWFMGTGESIRNSDGSPLRMAGAIIDIHDRKTAEQWLEKTRLDLDQIISSSGHMIVATEVNGTIRLFNPTAEKLLGYTAEEMIGKLTPAVIHDPVETAAKAKLLSKELGRTIEPGFSVFTQKADKGIAEQNEWTYIRKDGSSFPALLTLTALFDSAGKIEGYLGTAVDLTEKKKHDALLKKKTDEIMELTDRMNLCMTSVGVGTWDLNAQTMEMLWDEHICKVFGIEPEEFKNTYSSGMGFVHPEDQERLGKEVMSAIAGETNFETKFRTTPKAGQVRWAAAKGKLYRNPDGTPDRMVGACWNISDSVEKQELFTLALEAAPNGMIVADFEGKIVTVNKEIQSIFGYKEGELLGKPVEFLVPESQSMTHPKLREKFITNPKVQKMGADRVVRGQRKDGTLVPLEIGLTPLKTPQGSFVLSSVVDISERLTTKEKLERSNKELEQFAYVASHDLQAPLRAVFSYTDLLKEELKLTDPEHKKWMQYILSSAKEMQTLINDLLTFSRISKQEQNIESVDLKHLVEQLSEDMIVNQPETVIEISSLPIINGNRTQWKQVFQNLIQNACKFRRVGVSPKIKISASDKNDVWELCVEDNGIGIEKQHFDRIFQVFQRLHAPGDFEGSGIGLAICKKVCEQYGGKIWVESLEGEGSRFFFSIPKSLMINTEVADDSKHKSSRDLNC